MAAGPGAAEPHRGRGLRRRRSRGQRWSRRQRRQWRVGRLRGGRLRRTDLSAPLLPNWTGRLLLCRQRLRHQQPADRRAVHRVEPTRQAGPQLSPLSVQGFTLQGCCRPDGLCGAMDTFLGLGCVNPADFGLPPGPPAERVAAEQPAAEVRVVAVASVASEHLAAPGVPAASAQGAQAGQGAATTAARVGAAIPRRCPGATRLAIAMPSAATSATAAPTSRPIAAPGALGAPAAPGVAAPLAAAAVREAAAGSETQGRRPVGSPTPTCARRTRPAAFSTLGSTTARQRPAPAHRPAATSRWRPATDPKTAPRDRSAAATTPSNSSSTRRYSARPIARPLTNARSATPGRRCSNPNQTCSQSPSLPPYIYRCN